MSSAWILLSGALASGWAQKAPEDLAQSAAETWLTLVDDGEYEDSWDSAAKLLQGAVTKEQWKQVAAGTREPLGKLVSRKLKSRTTSKSLPGAPDGMYVVIQFDTVFEKKASAVETVTPMLDSDGFWRVSGYYIR
jgi:hypothetical protein